MTSSAKRRKRNENDIYLSGSRVRLHCRCGAEHGRDSRPDRGQQPDPESAQAAGRGTGRRESRRILPRGPGSGVRLSVRRRRTPQARLRSQPELRFRGAQRGEAQGRPGRKRAARPGIPREPQGHTHCRPQAGLPDSPQQRPDRGIPAQGGECAHRGACVPLGL